MIITSFYYLAYPDSSPPDELLAASEVYVEVSETEGNIDNFDFTYSLHIYTIDFIRQQLKEKPFFLTRSAIVVDRFDDSTIKIASESI
jgi:hypothetical protein